MPSERYESTYIWAKIALDEIRHKYVKYPDGVVRTLARSTPAQFDALVVAIYCSNITVDAFLEGIDRLTWASDERWWIIETMLERKRICIYNSVQEAEKGDTVPVRKKIHRNPTKNVAA